MRSFRVIFWRFMIYALLGLLLEVTMGAVVNFYHGNPNLRGCTSIWMILDYGLLGIVLMPIRSILLRIKFPLLARAIIYMLAIYLVEYVSGRIFTACGLKIWDYSHMKYQLHGQIALAYAPVWYCLGMTAELIYPKINAIAQLLSRK